MNIKTIVNDIYMLSMNIDEMLFEGMWELPKGVTLNSYVVKGEKTAVIDGFIGWDGIPETLYAGFAKIGINPEEIDYLVVNHMEPDHSGWIENFKKVNDHFKILVSKKGAALIDTFYGGAVNVQIVEEGDTLDLGNGKKLSFHMIPNVHWPETMMTFEHSTKSLFTCDLFGAFGAFGEHCFADEMTQEELDMFETEGIRYFSNVLSTFANMAERAVIKSAKLAPAIIAPGHGPVYRNNPEKIIDAYTRYCQYAKGYGKNEVTMIWGSMYGMTEKAVNFVENVLAEAGVKLNSVRMPQTPQTKMVTDAFKSAGLIIAAPTYEYKMFPPIAHAIDELGRKKINGKNVFRFGSYGWSGGAEKELTELVEKHRLTWKFVETVEFAGVPREADYQKLKAAVLQLVENIKDFIIE